MTKTREISDHPNKQITKNAIINANFDVWQRGTSAPPSTLTQYLADRWLTSVLLSTSFMQRSTFVIGQTDVPNNPTYYMTQNTVAIIGPGNFVRMDQRIEHVSTFANETVTLSFWAKADAPKNIAVEYTQNFGTGGAPSAEVQSIGVTTIPLTTTWQKFITTVDIPSVTGKTIGTNNDHFLQLGFWMDAGTNHDARTNTLGQQTGTFDFSQIQLEKGHVESNFEKRTRTEETLLCYRYYENSYDETTFPGSPLSVGIYAITSGSTAIGGATATVVYKSEKRIIPTTTIYNPITGSAGQMNRATFGAVSAGIVSGLTNAIGFNNVITTDSTQHSFHWTADAEL